MLKKNLLRLIAMILALAMIVAVSCSCKKDSGKKSPTGNGDTEFTDWEEVGGGDSNSSTNGGSSSGGDNKVTDKSTKEGFVDSMPKNLRGTTLTYFYWWDAYDQMEKEAIESFTKRTGIKVKTQVGSYSSFQTELTAKIAAGNSPDLIRTLSNAMYQVASLQPITNSGYDFSDDIWWKAQMKNYTYNGKCYAVNIRPKDAAILDTYVCYYNKRTIKANDLEDPYTIWKKNPNNWTWKKFWSMCEEFLEINNYKNGYIGCTFGGYNNLYARMNGCSNYDYNPSTGKWENNMDNPALATAWSELLTLRDKKLTSFNAEGVGGGKTLFSFSGPFGARTKDETMRDLKASGNLGIVPIPTDNKYQVLYEYTAFGIPQGAKNKEAVPYYLRWVLDKSSYDLNKVYFSEEAKNVMEYTLSMSDDKYYFGENSVYAMEAALLDATPDQVKTIIKTYKGKIQESVNISNEAIGKLSK